MNRKDGILRKSLTFIKLGVSLFCIVNGSTEVINLKEIHWIQQKETTNGTDLLTTNLQAPAWPSQPPIKSKALPMTLPLYLPLQVTTARLSMIFRGVESFQAQLNNLDTAPIRGEYKLWIFRCLLIPSFHFSLAVDAIPECALKKMEALATQKVKRWLGLPRCFSTAAIHHPHVIDIPSLPA